MAAERLINLVGTRCVDGNHAALERWYLDHVHQLFADPGLLGARLFRRDAAGQGADAGAAPEYLCAYDFADETAFAAYEAGPVKAAAAADRERGWGREGIEIVLRCRLRRLYRRERFDGPAAPRSWTIAAFGDAGALPVRDQHDDRHDDLRKAAAGAASIEICRALDAGAPFAWVGWFDGPAVPVGHRSAWQASYLGLWRWGRS